MNAWLKEIDGAKTAAEVVTTTRDYVSLWSPPELADFPADCRQIHIETQADIPRISAKLAAALARARERSQNAERLDDLVSYLARASERLRELG